MSDDHIKSEISTYLTGGLTEARNRQVEMHMASCEKCHLAMNKARTRQAHQNREALKKAAADRMPNLFLARQGKETGADRPPSRTPWLVGGLLLLCGGIYLAISHHKGKHPAAVVSPQVEGPVLPSTATPSVPVAEKAALPPVPVARAAEPPAIQAVQVWKGSDSGIKDSRLLVVRNDDAWGKLWDEMGTAAPRPPVTFGRQIVIGVFAGEQPPGTTVSLGRIRETEADIAVPYEVQRGQVAVSSLTLPTHPYLLSLLPRADKKIRLTQWEASE